MKCLLINIIVFLTAVNSDTSKSLFFPNLPVGKYRLNFLGMMPCVSIKSNGKIQFNFHLRKKSANTTEVRANVTYSVPVDDTLSFEVDMAVKDSIGGWRENAFVYKSPKACSTLKYFLGDAWVPFLKSTGMLITSCPFAPGYYESTGIDANILQNSNISKSFFYGTYRFRFLYTKHNEIYGCFTIVVEVKRPWETN